MLTFALIKEICSIFPQVYDDATVSSPEEDKTGGGRKFSTKEEQASRLVRGAQRSRESGSVDKGRQLPQINTLKEQVKDLKEKLKAKNEELQTKLDQIDIKYQDIEQQLEAANQEIDELKKTSDAQLEAHKEEINDLKKTSDAQLEAHKEEIKQKDIEIRKAAVQVKSLQEQNDKAKQEEPPQQQIDDITKQLTEQWTAITQLHKDEHERNIQQREETHSDKIAKLTKEHQEEIKKARNDFQDQLAKSIREELEKEIRDEYEKRRDEDIQKAESEESKRWQALNQQLKDKHEQKLNQIRDDHMKALAEKTQKHEEDVAALREQARTLELKNGDYVGEVIEHGSPSTSPEQRRYARKIDQPHQMIADIDLEKDHLKTELAVQQQRVRDLQHELDHQKEQYGQLEIQAIAKQQSFLSLSPTEGDVSRFALCIYIIVVRESAVCTCSCMYTCTLYIHLYCYPRRVSGHGYSSRLFVCFLSRLTVFYSMDNKLLVLIVSVFNVKASLSYKSKQKLRS